LSKADRLKGRAGTVRAMTALSAARLLVAFAPFDRWRGTLGRRGGSARKLAEAQRLARQVDWAAQRLPFETRCLPRAIALSWLLRRRKIGHAVVIAARPAELRGKADDLHAWVEIGGTKLIGELPGPWIEVAHFGSRSGTGSIAHR
jgi:hypothetical protein